MAGMESRIPVAKIEGAFGVRGEVRVRPFAGEVTVLPQVKTCWLEKGGQTLSVTIEKSWWHKDSLILHLSPLLQRESAQAMAGGMVVLSRAQLPPVSEGEYYQSDLIGFTVVNQTGGLLGALQGFLDTRGQPVAVVETQPGGGKEILFPFVTAVVQSVLTAEKKIVVDWELDYS